MAKAATKPPRVRVTTAQVQKIRDKAKSDPAPKWNDCEDWDAKKFKAVFREAMDYYRLDADSKTYKVAVISWMTTNEYTKEQLQKIKSLPDWKFSSTVGGIASCLIRGMTPSRPDFNNGNCAKTWLQTQIQSFLETPDSESETAVVVVKPVPKDRTHDQSCKMSECIEVAFEKFQCSPEKFNLADYNILADLKSAETKPAHAKLIKDYYSLELMFLERLASGNADEQLKEAHQHLTKKQVRTFIEFLKKVNAACDMIINTAKAQRKPRVKKDVPKEKLIVKLKYLKTYDVLNLVSINPIAIVGAKELWCFDTKTRKLSKYIASPGQSLSIKNSSIINFDETQSVAKTLRKPAEQLAGFKNLTKVTLKKFIDTINTVEIKPSGRISETHILLKALS